MRKLFSIFAAMLMVLTANATIRNISPTQCFEGTRNDGYTLYVELARGAQAGDTIVMADGEYLEGQSIPVNVPVVIMAAEGAKPVVKMSGYFQVKASINVQGVTFQFVGAEGNGYCFYFYENTPKFLKMKDCEFKDFTQYCVSSWEDFHVDSIIVSDCYFRDLAKGPFYLKASGREDLSNTCDKLVVKNTTFENIDINGYVSVIDIRNNDGSSWVGNENEMLVDHCTFYNIHGEYNRIIMSYKSAKSTVSNCIFAQPTDNQFYPTYNYGGSILNNLSYNTKSHRSGPTLTGNITGDPLFKDAANGDLTLGEGSPALAAGTDGSNLGDPRWWPAAPALPVVAIAGSMNSWSTTANVLTPAEDKKSASATITLNDYYYEFKVVVDGDWLSLGDDAQNLYTLHRDWNKVSGLQKDKQNFKLTPDVVPGDYTFKWTYETGELEIIFPEKGLPTVALAGTMNEWSSTANVLTPAEDKKTASIKVALEAKDYEFKMVVDNHWLAMESSYELKRDWNSVEGVDKEIAMGPNIVLKADVAGDYIFTWTFEGNKLAVTFPAIPVVVTATPNIEGAGTITGAGTVEKGASVTLKATANTGYHFCGWKDGETNATRTFTATEDVTYVALFRANVANPYAYALSSVYDDQAKKLSVQYALNAPADKVEIVVYNGDAEIDVQEQAAEGLTVGKHTATISCDAFAPQTKLTWAVRVNGLSPLAPVQHGTQYSMYCPHGVAVDNNPESEYFGRILATESMHSVTSKTAQAYISGSEANGAGIYAFSPDFKVIASAEGKNVFNGGEVFKNTFTGYGAGTAFAPLRVRISDDGRIFATALDDRGTFLWELSQDLTTWTPLVSGTINEGVIRDNEGKFLGAFNAALEVAGSGEDLKLLALSCNGAGYQGYNGKNYFVHEYKIGTAKTLTAAPDSLFSLDGVSSTIVSNQASLVYDGQGGYWLGNSRSAADQVQLAHLNAEGKRDWYATAGGFYGGGGVMFKDGLLYVGKDRTSGSVGNFGIYTVNRDEQGVVTGIKEVFAVRCDGIGRNINDFAMDFGHNLFIVGNSNEKIEQFALPYDGENETPAAQKFAFFVGGDPTAITTINDELIPVEKVILNGQVLIIRDGKAYNMMGQIVR